MKGLETTANLALGWLVTCTSNPDHVFKFSSTAVSATASLLQQRVTLHVVFMLVRSCSGGRETAGFKLPLV